MQTNWIANDMDDSVLRKKIIKEYMDKYFTILRHIAKKYLKLTKLEIILLNSLVKLMKKLAQNLRRLHHHIFCLLNKCYIKLFIERHY
jgi:hypothetical protein